MAGSLRYVLCNPATTSDTHPSVFGERWSVPSSSEHIFRKGYSSDFLPPALSSIMPSAEGCRSFLGLLRRKIMELVLSIEDTKEVANTKIKRLHYVPHQAPEQVVVSEATGCMCYIPRYGVHSARLRKSRVFISMSLICVTIYSSHMLQKIS